MAMIWSPVRKECGMARTKWTRWCLLLCGAGFLLSVPAFAQRYLSLEEYRGLIEEAQRGPLGILGRELARYRPESLGLVVTDFLREPPPGRCNQARRACPHRGGSRTRRRRGGASGARDETQPRDTRSSFPRELAAPLVAGRCPLLPSRDQPAGRGKVPGLSSRTTAG